MLGVHVQHFQNLYNAEIRKSNAYCCCDISYIDVPCGANITDLNVTACTSECEPYFEIRFKVCFDDGTCSSMETEISCNDSIPSTSIHVSPLLLQLYSSQSINGSISNVSAKKASFKLYTCMYVNEPNGSIP